MSDNLQVVTHWAGEPITDYSKEQLVEIVTQLGRALERERELHGKTIDALGNNCYTRARMVRAKI